MAYRRRRTRRTYARRAPARSYGRRYVSRRRRTPARRSSPRLVIQVVGGAGGVATSPISIGMKAARTVRSRY